MAGLLRFPDTTPIASAFSIFSIAEKYVSAIFPLPIITNLILSFPFACPGVLFRETDDHY